MGPVRVERLCCDPAFLVRVAAHRDDFVRGRTAWLIRLGLEGSGFRRIVYAHLHCGADVFAFGGVPYRGKCPYPALAAHRLFAAGCH